MSLQQASPVQRQASVIVIGAGLAGLAAAYNLRQMGVDVLLVEARQRIGGRVHTLPLAHGDYFDAGGEFVSPGHKAFLRYAKHFSIALEDSRFYEQKPRITLGRQALSPEQAQTAMGDIEDVFAGLAHHASEVDPAAPWAAAKAQTWDSLSLSDWLDAQSLAPQSRALLRLYWEAGNGIDLASQSFLGVLAQTAADSHPVNALRCIGGTSALPQAFAAALGDERIFLGHPVVGIDYDNGVRVITQDGSVFASDWVILATPPGTWQNVRCRPEIHDVPQMGTVSKFVQVFHDSVSPPPHAFCDAYITAIWPGTARVVVGFSGGPAAQRCCNLPASTREDFLKSQAVEMLGHPLPGLHSTYFQDWTAEPFTRGGYSAPAPGQMMRMQARWQQPHHRLIFAGEHTSPAFFGFMEGALQSGETAAELLIKQAFASPA